MPSDYEKANGMLESMLKYRFWQKAEERPAHAAQIAAITDRPNLGFCPMNHDQMAYAGPPFPYIGPLMKYVCLFCGQTATWDECRDRGYQFADTPDFIIQDIMNTKLVKQNKKPNSFLIFAKR